MSSWNNCGMSDREMMQGVKNSKLELMRKTERKMNARKSKIEFLEHEHQRFMRNYHWYYDDAAKIKKDNLSIIRGHKNVLEYLEEKYEGRKAAYQKFVVEELNKM